MIVPSAAPVLVQLIVALDPLAGRKLTMVELVPGSASPVVALSAGTVPPV